MEKQDKINISFTPQELGFLSAALGLASGVTIKAGNTYLSSRFLEMNIKLVDHA